MNKCGVYCSFSAPLSHFRTWARESPKNRGRGSKTKEEGIILGTKINKRGKEYFVPFAGRLFDEHGNLASWWNNQSVEAFQQHASCMVNQYANFSVAGMNVRLA